MIWIFENTWDPYFATLVIVEIAKVIGWGLLIGASFFVLGYVLFRLLRLLERSY